MKYTLAWHDQVRFAGRNKSWADNIRVNITMPVKKTPPKKEEMKREGKKAVLIIILLYICISFWNWEKVLIFKTI